jgi:hypothetical protein
MDLADVSCERVRNFICEAGQSTLDAWAEVSRRISDQMLAILESLDLAIG